MSDTTIINPIADAIIQSDLISARTADAVLLADSYAEGGPVTIDHCRLAAKHLRAKLRLVAAAFGFLRCSHCDEWIPAAHEIDPDAPGQCLHLLDLACDQQEAALVTYLLLTGQPIHGSFVLNAKMEERMRRAGHFD